VSNPAGSSANLVFKEGEDFFSCDPLVRSILELEGRVGNGVAAEALVQPVNGLHGSFANISKGLRKLMKVMANTAAGQLDVVKVPRPVGRRRLVEAAPSREEAAGRQEAIPLGRQEAIPLGLTEQEGSGTAATATMVTTGLLPGVLVGSLLSTPAPTSTPERHTCVQGTEENAEDVVDIIVGIRVTQPEVAKVAEVVVAARTPIQARQAVLQRRLSREFETPAVAEMIVEEPMIVPPVMAQNEVIPVQCHVQRAKATKKGDAPKPVKALVP
jgi:hypothetical protein